MHQPQRVENARILIANTPMDTDKIKVFGSRVKVDNIAKASIGFGCNEFKLYFFLNF
jgi:chaperonin GroEL (HSP60 family)